jgi:hypothetical protein
VSDHLSALFVGWRRRASEAVKMIAEYLENAMKFERLAAEECDPTLKAVFEEQARAYRRLADERADRLGLAPPPRKH